MSLRGIDVSRHNGSIDWERLAPHVDEVLIRASLGHTGRDDRYAENWRQSGWAGVELRGVYHYNVTGYGGRGAFDNLMRVTGGDLGNAPVVVDCERTTAEREAMLGGWRFPKERYTGELEELCGLLAAYHAAGVRLYSNYYEWVTVTTQPAWARAYGLHIAGYPAVVSLTNPPRIPRPWLDDEWAAWQYTASGRLPGIAGNVDQSFVKLAAAPAPAPGLALLDELREVINGKVS